MAGTRCVHAIALLSLLPFATFCSAGEFFSDAPAESQTKKAAKPKSPPGPLESEPQRQVVQMELKGQGDTEPKLGCGTCQWLNPLEAAPEEELQEPEYKSENPIYYAATFGDAEDNVFAFAIGDLDSNGLFNDVEQGLFKGDRFFVDLDGEGRMESFPYGRYTRIEGVWYSIAASLDGSRVEIARAHPALGRIEVPSQIIEARLSSPTQPLDLKFVDGSGSAVAGTYRVQSVRLLAEGELADGWALGGSFLGREPELTVVEGQSTRLEAGLPLKVEPQLVVDEERTLSIRLRLSGAGGESYRWSPRRGSSSRAGFEILDSSGKRIASCHFEYG